MDLRRLLTLFSRLIRNRRTVKQDSRFLDLPLTLIYDIFDELQLPEKILLSQTSRDLWYSLRYKCSSVMQKATAVERLSCLAVLGSILPDHRLCTYCRALHLVDLKDLPVTALDNPHRPCPAPETPWDRHRLMCYYSIAFRHVQMALKYTRLGDLHQGYRASILQTFTTSFPISQSMKLKFTAKSTIVNGRFLLMTTFLYYEVDGLISYSQFSQLHFRFCAHLGAGKFLKPDNPLFTAVRLASDVADS